MRGDEGCILCMRWVLRAGALGRPKGMGWAGRREGESGWGTHVNPWLIHVNVWQKPLQYCKVFSLQQIKINGKKKKYPHWQLTVHLTSLPSSRYWWVLESSMYSGQDFFGSSSVSQVPAMLERLTFHILAESLDAQDPMFQDSLGLWAHGSSSSHGSGAWTTVPLFSLCTGVGTLRHMIYMLAL